MANIMAMRRHGHESCTIINGCTQDVSPADDVRAENLGLELEQLVAQMVSVRCHARPR